MNEALEALLEAQHAEWIKHPVTQKALERIREHKNSFVKIISNDVMNPNVSDVNFRHTAVNIRNCDAILSLLTNTDVFFNNHNKPTQQ